MHLHMPANIGWKTRLPHQLGDVNRCIVGKACAMTGPSAETDPTHPVCFGQLRATPHTLEETRDPAKSA